MSIRQDDSLEAALKSLRVLVAAAYGDERASAEPVREVQEVAAKAIWAVRQEGLPSQGMEPYRNA